MVPRTTRPRREKPRVIYRLNSPAPYAVERFNVIHRRGNIDLEAWFDSERAPDRSWTVRTGDWEFPGRYVDPSAFEVVRRVRKAAPDVYFSLYENFSFSAGVLAARSTGAKTVLRVLKTFDTWRKRSPRNEVAKHVMFRLVDAIHTTGPDGEAYARSYGARDVIKFHEPIDVPRFRAGAATSRSNTRMRGDYGLNGCVFLYVGRLWRAKGLDYLFDAFQRLRQETSEVSLLLVGDGVDEVHYRERAATIPNVVFAGFVQQPDLPNYYGLSDVFVFPTLGDPYGHVVHEAMASSVPVISTANAGDIRERIVEGETGFIVPPADSDALLDKMRILATNASLRQKMAASGFALVETRTNEWWAQEFESMVYSLASFPAAGVRSWPEARTASSNPTHTLEGADG